MNYSKLINLYQYLNYKQTRYSRDMICLVRPLVRGQRRGIPSRMFRCCSWLSSLSSSSPPSWNLWSSWFTNTRLVLSQILSSKYNLSCPSVPPLEGHHHWFWANGLLSWLPWLRLRILIDIIKTILYTFILTKNIFIEMDVIIITDSEPLDFSSDCLDTGWSTINLDIHLTFN